MVNQRNNKGFTLIELAIVIAIVGIITAIAVPQYTNHVRKAKFTDLKASVFPLKVQLIECYNNNGTNAAICNTSTASQTDTWQVTTDMLARAAVSDAVGSVTITADNNGPKITVIPAANNGFLSTDTYELIGITATSSSGGLYIQDWQQAGGGCAKNWC